MPIVRNQVRDLINGTLPAHTRDAIHSLNDAMQARSVFVVTFPAIPTWAKDGTDKNLGSVQAAAPSIPIPFVIKAVHLTLGTAPGSGKTVTLKAKGTSVVTVTDTSLWNYGANLNIQVAANDTNFFTISETSGGTGANAVISMVCQPTG